MTRRPRWTTGRALRPSAAARPSWRATFDPSSQHARPRQLQVRRARLHGQEPRSTTTAARSRTMAAALRASSDARCRLLSTTSPPRRPTTGRASTPSPAARTRLAINYRSSAEEEDGRVPLSAAAPSRALATSIRKANIDDASCAIAISGCTNPKAPNYYQRATVDDNSCIIPGCTNSLAANYAPAATTEDGSCLPLSVSRPSQPSQLLSRTREGGCTRPGGKELQRQGQVRRRQLPAVRARMRRQARHELCERGYAGRWRAVRVRRLHVAESQRTTTRLLRSATAPAGIACARLHEQGGRQLRPSRDPGSMAAAACWAARSVPRATTSPGRTWTTAAARTCTRAARTRPRTTSILRRRPTTAAARAWAAPTRRGRPTRPSRRTTMARASRE